MEIKEIGTDDSYTHLALIGRLDVVGVGDVENKFIGYTVSRKKNAVVDLAGVSFLGSMGIRLFLSSAKALDLENKKLILVNPKPLVQEVLETSGITNLIALEDNTEAAILKAKESA